MGQLGCRALCLGLLDYKTEKYVVVKNKKVGLLYRLLQLAILLYLLGWVFLEKKGYQVVDTAVQSSVITKVKGVAFTNTSELREKIWDEADYVMPSQGGNAFFVITSLIVTPRQRQTTCAESPHVPHAVCSQDSDCPRGEAVLGGHGVRTGRCVRAGSKGRGTCEISAWCPVEGRRRPEKLLLEKAADFTVYIKNSIRFPQFNFSKSNVRDTKDKSFLKSCHFGPHNHYCPIFRLGSLVHAAGHDFREMALEVLPLELPVWGRGVVTLRPESPRSRPPRLRVSREPDTRPLPEPPQSRLHRGP